MSSVNVPKIQFTPTGIVLPSEADILAGVQEDINAAFGGNVNPALETPQGQIASSTTAIIGDVNNNFAQFVNYVDPQHAEGVMQDAIAKIYFLDRKPAFPTTVSCNCVGLAGTIIPAGSKVIDSAKNIYICTNGGTIPSGGSISLQFSNVNTGPIACNAHAVNKIYKAIPGWDTVDNPLSGVVGSKVESRSDFEIRRYNSVAINGQHSLQSIYGEVFNCDGVLDVYCAENCANIAATFGSTAYSIDAHAIYVAVSGGIQQDIAKAILRKKSLGCGTMGSQSVTVYETSGFSPPYPSYTIKYHIPSTLQIKCAVTIVVNTFTPAGTDGLIRTAIVNAFIGADGSARERIGQKIYSSKYYAPVSNISELFSVNSILFGSGSGSASYPSVAVGIDQIPTIQESDIVITHI